MTRKPGASISSWSSNGSASRASDLTDQARITSTCRRAGVRIATPERTYDLRLAEDDFESDLHGILSKREKRKLLERTKRGLDAAKDAGKFAGGRPMLGYKFDHEHRKIVPDLETAPLVQRIFESDLSAWQLHRQLESEGIHVWYQTIRRIRSHPFYLGKRKNTRGELIDADWPAIVDEKLWEKWQRPSARLARRSPRPRGSVYLLSALVRCRDCGGPVVGRPTQPAKDGTPLFAYRCHEGTKCSAGGGKISGRSVDAMVVQALTDYVKDPNALRARYRQAVVNGDSPDRATMRAQVVAEVQDLDDRESRLMDAVERGVITDNLVRRRLKTLEGERKLLHSREESLLVAEGAATLPSLEMILAVAARLPDGDKDVARKLLEMLAHAVLLAPRQRTLVLKWRLGGEAEIAVQMQRGGSGRSIATMGRRAQDPDQPRSSPGGSAA